MNGVCHSQYELYFCLVSHARGLFTPADKIEIVFETSIPKYCMMTIFVLKNIIHTGNY